MKRILFFSLGLSMLLSACTSNTQNNADAPDALAMHIDTALPPGADFFMYANGRWFKENPIPASEQSNGLWQMIRDTINSQVMDICESSANMKDAPKGSIKQKIGDFFASGMDSVSLNTKKLSDLKVDLDRIAAIKDSKDMMNMASYFHPYTSAPMFNFYVGQDDKNSSKYAVFVAQGGLSLPDRTYYVDMDARAVNVRAKFVEHVAAMFVLMGDASEKAKSSAEAMMKLETAMAKAARKREDTRDPIHNYNKMTIAQLQKLTPTLDWRLFVDAVGLKNVDSVIVGQPEYLVSLNGLCKQYPMDVWKDYFRYKLIQASARYLDDQTYTENFNFYSGVLRGVKEQRPRWKRTVDQTNNALGELIGQVYVDEYLPKGTKEKLLEIGESIRSVYAERINQLDWMSEGTKQKAQEKLKAIVMKVGYPDKWKDMSGVSIDRSSYIHNVMNTSKWEFDYMINKYGKPVDRTEWDMQPQTYNAYYNPSNNEIVVPGCNIIVPGYERQLADDALLYSIIGGSTFGHEITHGFDDQGSKYDELGNLNNWWTPEDSTKFYTKTKMIVKQFSEYVAVDSLHINGELTQGENIADLGGIMMGYEAFKKTAQYKDKKDIAGLNPDKRFFLGYALAWMINDRPEAIADQVKSNEHSPAKFRVLGPLSDMPEFYAAFGIKEGDAMYRADSVRVKIW